MVPCPLCGNEKSKVIDRFQVRQLIEFYKEKLKSSYDIGKLLGDGRGTISLRQCSHCAMKFFDPLIPGDDGFYSSMASNADGYYMEVRPEFKTAARHIQGNMKVLDIGCGIGQFSTQIPESDYTGLELSSFAQSHSVPGARILQERIQQHAPQHKEEYDAVVIFQVLEHLPTPNDFLRSALECLKAGGILVISVPSDDGYIGSLTNCYHNIIPHHLLRFPDQTLRSISDIFSLELLELTHEPVEDLHIRTYWTGLAYKWLCSVFGIRYRVWDTNTLRRKVINRLIRPFVNRAVRDFGKPYLGYGHSITAIYRKS